MDDHTVTVGVIDEESVKGTSGDPGSGVDRLCSAIRSLQNHGLNVVVVSHRADETRAEIEMAHSWMNIDMHRFLCIKAYNHPGFVDSLFLAVEYEGFCVTSADLSNLQNDWRLPRQDKAFLKANPGLLVSFAFDSNGAFHPKFAPGVIPGDFAVAVGNLKRKMSKSELDGRPQDRSNSAANMPRGWVTDNATPELAVSAVDCNGTRCAVVAILGVDEKDPLLQSASNLCSEFDFGEVEWMEDWKFPVKTPWRDVNGGGNLPHVVYLKSRSLSDLWAIGISSRKKTRQRAAKLALFVAHRAHTEQTVTSATGLGAELQNKVLKLVERAKKLCSLVMSEPAEENLKVEEVGGFPDDCLPQERSREDSPANASNLFATVGSASQWLDI